MTNADAIRKAVSAGDARLAGQWADKMRALGANYAQTCERAMKLTGCTANQWETLMYEADSLESEG